MKVYQIYEHPEHGRKAVKEGFSWPGFFFTFLWALYNRLWLAALVGFLFGMGFRVGIRLLGPPNGPIVRPLLFFVTSSVLVSFGVFGNRWVGNSLVRRGYFKFSRINARKKREALEKSRNLVEEQVTISPFRKYLPYTIAVLYVLMITLPVALLLGYYIPSPGMLDTLKINDRVFVYRYAYTTSPPEVGDIVVFHVPETIPRYDPEKPIWIKRIVGVGGDTVSIAENQLRVNGSAVEENPFLMVNSYKEDLYNEQVFEEVTVPQGEVLVFGDNSWNSYDGRYWGTFPEENILGKVVFRFWPLSRFGTIEDESVRPLSDSSRNAVF